MADYIPGSDTAFGVWVNNFVTYANAHLPELGIIPPDMIPITAALSDFEGKMTNNVTAQQTAQSARQAKGRQPRCAGVAYKDAGKPASGLTRCR